MPWIAAAHGFTGRERRVTELVAQGFTTRQIAARLGLSPYPVQDHLKSILEKTGTGGRRDLVARILFDHDAPSQSTTPPADAPSPPRQGAGPSSASRTQRWNAATPPSWRGLSRPAS